MQTEYISLVNKEQLNGVLHLVVRSFLPRYLFHKCCSVLYWMLQFWAAKGAGGEEIEHIKRKGGNKTTATFRRHDFLYKNCPKVCQISARIYSPYIY